MNHSQDAHDAFTQLFIREQADLDAIRSLDWSHPVPSGAEHAALIEEGREHNDFVIKSRCDGKKESGPKNQSRERKQSKQKESFNWVK